MKNAIILTGNKYPNGDAGALRQQSIAKILQHLGYTVMIYGMGEYTSNSIKENDGVLYTSLRGHNNSRLCRIKDRLTWGSRAFKQIKKSYNKIDVLIVVDDNPLIFKKAEKISKLFNCILIHDCVEWYSPDEFKFGKLSIQYNLKNHINTKSINSKWSVISISSYLEEWFISRAKRTVTIPVILNMSDVELNYENRESNRTLKIVYAGAPGKKDSLNHIIEGFSALNKNELNRVELHIIGVTKEQLVKNCNVESVFIDKMGKSLYVHGRIPHAEAVEWVKKADYTVLLRNNELRYAKAGFPTKIVESLKYGTPPICNLSSDLNKYLLDKNNSIIIDGYNSNSVTDAIKKALSISEDEYMFMRKNARETAMKSFDYRKYINALSFLLEITEKEQ